MEFYFRAMRCQQLHAASVLVTATCTLSIANCADFVPRISRPHTISSVPNIATDLEMIVSLENTLPDAPTTIQQQPNNIISEHPSGPPPLLDDLANSSQQHCRRDAFGSLVHFDVERISDTPDMLLLRNFVSTAERYTLQ